MVKSTPNLPGLQHAAAPEHNTISVGHVMSHVSFMFISHMYSVLPIKWIKWLVMVGVYFKSGHGQKKV
jgi:hypothetical protein